MRWDLFEEELLKIATATIATPPAATPQTGPPQIKSPSAANVPKPPSAIGARTVPTTKSITTMARKATGLTAAPPAAKQDNAFKTIRPLSPMAKQAGLRSFGRTVWDFLKAKKKLKMDPVKTVKIRKPAGKELLYRQAGPSRPKPLGAIRGSRAYRYGLPTAVGAGGLYLGTKMARQEEQQRIRQRMHKQYQKAQRRLHEQRQRALEARGLSNAGR